MKRSDFLAILSMLPFVRKAKTQRSDLTAALDRHKPLNKKIQVQEWKDGKWVTKWIL